MRSFLETIVLLPLAIIGLFTVAMAELWWLWVMLGILMPIAGYFGPLWVVITSAGIILTFFGSTVSGWNDHKWGGLYRRVGCQYLFLLCLLGAGYWAREGIHIAITIPGR